MNEIWRDIPGFEGLYQASTLGRIKSLDHNYKTRGFNVFYLGVRKGRILKPIRKEDGYFRVCLSNSTKQQLSYVHRLVATTFPEICGEQFPGAQINHLNEDKSDNRAINLRFCTVSENANWGTRNQRVIKNLCKPVLQYALDGTLIKKYPSQHEASRQTGINVSRINDCCSGKRLTAGGFKWSND